MSNQSFGPRVFEGEARSPETRSAPRVMATERTERIVAVQPAPRVPATVPPRSSTAVSAGLAGIGVFVAGWLVVDAYEWVAAAFARSTMLGSLAAAAVVAGVAGAGTIIVREIASLRRLRNVETIRRRLAGEVITPADGRRIVSDILAVVPRERGVQAAIDTFSRQVQPHHDVSQQLELLSRGVMAPLDAVAQDHIRAAVLRGFGITAISPTAVTDALFFLAVGVRMVRRIAETYGHRPTAATTLHLLRRLIVEAGKLGVVDIASNSLAHQLGGAVAERLASTAADAFYASYRMARLGVIVMDLCRPVPFRDDQVPSLTSLVTNVLRQRKESVE